jgi:hypothetical protein
MCALLQNRAHVTHDEDKEPRDIGNIGYTRHRTKTNKTQNHNTKHKNGQPRDIGNIGYTRHMTKTNNLETLATLGTQDT